MSTTATPLAELTVSAIRLLCQEMGIVNTARFLNQFTAGVGNYTDERDLLFGQMTVEELVTEIKSSRTEH